MGTFFVRPVYLQVVLGLDAFETGKTLLPLSACDCWWLHGRTQGRRQALAPTVAQAGLVAISAGAVVMSATLDVTLNDTGFKTALVLIGLGAGLLASQLGNVIMSSVDPSKSSEAGGLQGNRPQPRLLTWDGVDRSGADRGPDQRLQPRVADNPQIPEPVRQTIEANTEEGIDIVPGRRGRAARRGTRAFHRQQPSRSWTRLRQRRAGRPEEGLGAVAAIALLSLWFTRRLPHRMQSTAT